MNKKELELKRKNRVRAKIRGTKDRPRLSVFRSNRFIYAQVINDDDQKTIIGVSQKSLKETSKNKIDKAKALGILLAQKALSKKIKKVMFDRGGYAYQGRIKAVAEGAREGGLEF